MTVTSSPPHADDKLLLVGDNPFLGVSHLSQDRARERAPDVTGAAGAGELLATALDHGANGFLFSVSELSLTMLSTLRRRGRLGSTGLYAIAPWSFEYVRAAVRLGGMPGLARELGERVFRSRNAYAVAQGINGAVRNDLGAVYKGYLNYEAARIRTAGGPDVQIASYLLHEVVGDMALGLDMEWLFRAHVEANRRAGTAPGYNTRNLPLLVEKFRRWDISLAGAVIAAPFNAEGFQMCPSRAACEAALEELPDTDVIAFSILAAGHLGYTEAIDYVATLPRLRGVAVGVSKPEHARSTFKDLERAFRREAV
jgi:hypothetical protein